ncbi:Iron transporter [Candidatus Hydrogenisulfobacillus filiaventi]|uniref:Iron transporter n=1 Tax=Candidatus Hydrogenisulfobacillus filiaventi TaxID=2707344 RepID=A0A6F8ZET7_9FIRM|nr:VIT1/CCC1 transporter family protein [Bacillota bacterium]CAB1128287.1 Iron transporter [Candidatus Hydrogenisulfobacillus filiaventi]
MAERAPRPGRETAPDGGILSRSLIRELVFGINDGTVSTIGLVSGEALSRQSHAAIIIAALSAAGAATISMAVGSYLASSSANDLLRSQIEEEREEIETRPEQERREVRDLLGEMGMPPRLIPEVQRHIVGNKAHWIRFMVREELGIHHRHLERPLVNAVAMGIAVILGSIPATLPFLLPLPTLAARNLAWGLALASSFLLGFAKARFTRGRGWLSGLEFMALTALSATVGAAIGFLVGRTEA